MVPKPKPKEVRCAPRAPRQGLNSTAGAACNPLPPNSPLSGCTGPPGNPMESRESRLDKMPNDNRS